MHKESRCAFGWGSFPNRSSCVDEVLSYGQCMLEESVCILCKLHTNIICIYIYIHVYYMIYSCIYTIVFIHQSVDQLGMMLF